MLSLIFLTLPYLTTSELFVEALTCVEYECVKIWLKFAYAVLHVILNGASRNST